MSDTTRPSDERDPESASVTHGEDSGLNQDSQADRPGPADGTNPGISSTVRTGQKRLINLAAAILCLIAVALVVSTWEDWQGLITELSAASSRNSDPNQQRSPKSLANFDSPFDLSGVTIPVEQILSGGPGKDGIPALVEPPTLTVAQANYLQLDDRVIGLTLQGESRAYPIRILNWHEVVNDVLGGLPIAVTYCPLCDSAVAFDRSQEQGEPLELRVSGLLYNSNVLMYSKDEDPERLWSQMKSEAVTGAGEDGQVQGLPVLPIELTTWADWALRHPETTVVDLPRASGRDYSKNPYRRYFAAQRQLFYPAQPQDQQNRLPIKQPVLGLWNPQGLPSDARAYPLSAFAETNEPVDVEDQIGGLTVKLRYDPQSGSLRVLQADPALSWAYSFWFAWYAFHPETEIYQEEQDEL